MLDLSNLNENQKKAVTIGNGPVIVVAGAGTGKTRVLTTRIAYLIENNLFNPDSILAITFTNKAANEMKERVNVLVKNTRLSWIGTYHSICLRILKEDIEHLNRSRNFGIIDDEDQMSLIKEIYKQFKVTKEICSTIKPKKALQLIEIIKFGNIDINNFAQLSALMKTAYIYVPEEIKAIRLIFTEYQRKLITNNLLDFNDLLIYTNKLLSANKEIRNKWQNRFSYILVDEFQDTNEIQFNILRMLINPKHKNIFVVGDPDQSIYKWRGAYEWIFKDFREQFPEAKLVILDTNYRSTKNILNGSNKLISNNFDRIKKNLITNNEQGQLINYFYGDNQRDEGEFVSKKIIELVKNGAKYSDIAILYRSNYLSRFCEDALMINNVPYKIFGGIRFYQRKEIKDLIAYLKLMIGQDEISLKRIINVPTRGIGETTISKIDNYSAKTGLCFFDCLNLQNQDWNWKQCNKFYQTIIDLRKEIKDKPVSEVLNKIIELTNYDEYLKSLDLEDKRENINELINSIKIMECSKELTIESYLDEISLYTDTSEQNNLKENFVSLMTVHVAKGLEFPIVFLVGFSNNIFPPAKSTDYQEERRIAYVAMTRARQQLYITCSDGYTFSGATGPSMFLKEIGYENMIKIEQEFKSISSADLDWYDSKKQNNDFSNMYEQKNINFVIGDVISHTTFGQGVVTNVEKDYLTVAFKAPYGIKTLMKNHKSIKRIKN